MENKYNLKDVIALVEEISTKPEHIKEGFRVINIKDLEAHLKNLELLRRQKTINFNEG